MSGNFGYMGRSNPWGDLDEMWHVGTYWRRHQVCNIWWLSVKGCEFGERRNFSLSHWLDVSPLQHWSHYHVTVWTMSTDCFDYTPKELTHFYSATRMQSADYAVASCHSVCPSVRLSQAGILSKQLNISSKFFSLSGRAIVTMEGE